ncbi:MAG: hypothetical protein COW00_12755 [Bdellovibrio sp. CG12_big_fil_rev_8_21_14_0_65_39_13]|nr:MAG: hypothetical protein COW78_05075 [Bdellovibrio sp. CG22_combo_CG10-13_8_21_14_all_39_27]PIQ58951.1 MAG: hypothetical protein COW00_12755 [Bdellovibrio sp. CG12_big_fil_rev_8_21_14_0_65_39_13]PIR33919.1 MAG: hypothetical protein COV37_14470 [Bdellovibrio sp. CG11_big_fil_rev_8_21_14_0_20_39_38]
MKRSLLLVPLLFLTQACTNLFDSNSYVVKGLDKDKLSIVYTHNLTGETHPCGCRHFPLGGLPQVAGKLNELKKTSDVIFVDVGDSFFPTIQVPKEQKESQILNANELSYALSEIGLNFHVPGDYDLAPGIEEYKKIVANKKYVVLVSNLKDENLFPHKKWALIEKGPHKIALIGLVNPAIYPSATASFFTDPKVALKEILKEAEAKGVKSNDPFSRVIVFSHSGMDFDEQLAKDFPNIDWIAGAHTQNFTTHPQQEGNTKIVQVLSKNHYLGNITIALDASKDKDSYSIIEVREELSKLLDPNPWTAWIDQHRTKINQIKEREMQLVTKSTGVEPFMSARSCLDCHGEQAQKWMSTPHSLAYITLLNAKEQNNPSCIGCHSLGFQSPQGFSNMDDIVHFKDVEADKKAAHMEEYLKELKQSFGKIASVRKLDHTQILKHAKKWQGLEDKFKVQDNYMNVQCLNCHSFAADHPFDDKSKRLDRQAALDGMKAKCLNCHSAEQAPEWYIKKENGLPGALDEKLFQKNIKAVGCPLMAK